MYTERFSQGLRRRRERDHRIAWCGANTFAQSIDEEHAGDPCPTRAHDQRDLGDRADGVAERSDGLLAPTSVGVEPAGHADERRGTLVQPVDEAELQRAEAELEGEVQRQHRSHHLRREIGEEAGEPEQHDGCADPSQSSRRRERGGLLAKLQVGAHNGPQATLPLMRVVGINRYPVKSLQGEQLADVNIATQGLTGDRRWGIVDVESGKVWSAKRHGELLGGSATTTPAGPVITLPDGTEIAPDDPTRDAQLSNWLGRSVELKAADVAGDRIYEASLQLDPDVDVFDMPMTPGVFLDLSPVHVLTTSSLRAGASAHPEGNWTTDRFRPSIVVGVEPGEGEGFIENDWVGTTIRVGRVELDVVLPTVRCVMTTRQQQPRAIERDLDIFKTINRVNQQNLGVYANVTQPGTVRLGDPVVVRAV